MTDTTISVPEIHCDHCKSSIEGAVTAIEGVDTVTVDIPSATVAVSFDEPAEINHIIAAIEGQGYEVTAN